MKKFVIKLLALLCAVTTTVSVFSGCLQSTPPNEPETPPAQEPLPEPEPEPTEPEPTDPGAEGAPAVAEPAHFLKTHMGVKLGTVVV